MKTNEKQLFVVEPFFMYAKVGNKLIVICN